MIQTDSSAIIECRGLTHYYGKRLIYEGLTFDVPRGRILGLLGKNGTGKTTTINILAGYLKPRSGVCKMLGYDIQSMPPEVKANIALLIEGHVQYSFMTVEEIEHFYARFYPRWQRDIYYDLVSLLKIAPHQRISRMSCGQRSQVALGLILAQDADLLVLDDFSLGLDPGYRRLFIDYLKEFTKGRDKTVFLTSHIIQDMERLIDDCIILDYGKILLQMPVAELMSSFHRYLIKLEVEGLELPGDPKLWHPAVIGNQAEVHSFEGMGYIREYLAKHQLPYSQLVEERMSLEDVFIGLTGKY